MSKKTLIPTEKHRSNSAFKRLQQLGPEKLLQIDTLFVTGMSANEVAKYIHSEWQLCLDVKFYALAKQLQRYKDEYLKKKIVITQQIDEPTRKNLIRKFEGEINVYNELGQLIATQRDRLNASLNQEGLGDFTTKAAREEIRLYASLLNQMSDLQFSMGVMKNHNTTAKFSIGPQGASIEVSQQLGTAVDRAMDLLGELVPEDNTVIEGELADA